MQWQPFVCVSLSAPLLLLPAQTAGALQAWAPPQRQWPRTLHKGFPRPGSRWGTAWLRCACRLWWARASEGTFQPARLLALYRMPPAKVAICHNYCIHTYLPNVAGTVRGRHGLVRLLVASSKSAAIMPLSKGPQVLTPTNCAAVCHLLSTSLVH